MLTSRNIAIRHDHISTTNFRRGTLAEGRVLLASAGADATVRLWDPVTGRSRATLTGHTGMGWVVAAIPMPGGRTLLASAGADETVRLWDPVTGSLRAEMTGHAGEVYAVAAVPLPDGRTLLASAGADETVQLWDPVTGSPQAMLTGHTDEVWAVAAIPMSDGTTLFASAGADRAVIIWSRALPTNSQRIEFRETDSTMPQLARHDLYHLMVLHGDFNGLHGGFN